MPRSNRSRSILARIAGGLLLACLAFQAHAQMPPGMMPQPPPADPAKVAERLAFLPEVLCTLDPDEKITRAEFIEMTAPQLGFILEPGMTDEMIKDELRPYVESLMQLRVVIACAIADDMKPDYDGVRAEITQAVATSGPQVLGGQDQEELVKMVAERNLASDWVSTKLVDTVEVPEADVLAFYEENKAQMGPGTPERRRIAHILVSIPPDATDNQRMAANAKATLLLTKLNDGADFAETAKASSECYSRRYGGDLGFLPEGSMGTKFDDVAYTLENGTMSGVVETHRGYHIIKITDLKPATAAPLTDALKERITDYLRQQKANPIVEARIAEESTKRNLKVAF